MDDSVLRDYLKDEEHTVKRVLRRAVQASALLAAVGQET